MSPRVARNRRRVYMGAGLLALAGYLVLGALALQGHHIPDGVYLAAFVGCVLAAAGYGDAARGRQLRRIRRLHERLERRARLQDPEGFRRWEEARHG